MMLIVGCVCPWLWQRSLREALRLHQWRSSHPTQARTLAPPRQLVRAAHSGFDVRNKKWNQTFNFSSFLFFFVCFFPSSPQRILHLPSASSSVSPHNSLTLVVNLHLLQTSFLCLATEKLSLLSSSHLQLRLLSLPQCTNVLLVT